MHQSAAIQLPVHLDFCSNLIEVLQFRAQEQPAHTVFKFLKDGEKETATLTYQRLDLRARAYAAHLQALGLRGERALLLYPSGPDFVAAFFACLYAGVIAVPAYPPRNARNLPRIQSIIADAQAKVALTTTAILAKMDALLERTDLSLGLRCVATDTLAEDCADAWTRPPVASSTLAFLQYTSGSTGTPKGVMLTHGNILANEKMIHAAFSVTSRDVGVGWLPLFHDMGLIGHVIQPVYAGIPSVLMSPAAFLQKPMRWLQAISEHRGTISGGPNFAYELCLRKVTPEERQTLDLSSWRLAYSGAEPVRTSTIEAFSKAFGPSGFRGKAKFPCYGLAEATLMISGGPAHAAPETLSVDRESLEQKRVRRAVPKAPNAHALVSCGSQTPGGLPDQRIVIADPDTGAPCAPNTIGEIWVAGAHVARGYWNRREETLATFRAYLAGSGEGPFLRTGDLGFIHNGDVVVTGRLKDLIVIRGRNVHPHDVEWVVERSHLSLQQGACAAFGVEVDGEERLVIVQELRPRSRPDLDEVLGTIRQASVEGYDIAPYEIVLVKPGSISKTSSGKLQRSITRANYTAGSLQVVRSLQCAASQQAADAHRAEPEVAKEIEDNVSVGTEAIASWLVAELAAQLKIPPSEVDIDQPFSHYGLASVEGVALAGKLEEWLGRPVPLSLVWDCPTIDATSKFLSQR